MLSNKASSIAVRLRRITTEGVHIRIGTRAAWFVLGAGFAVCGLESNAFTIQGMTVESGGIRASAVVSPGAAPRTSSLRVEVIGGDKTASWQYEDYSLDSERSGNIPVEILDQKDDLYLLVHAYSNGANCCWTLLAYDLKKQKPLGEFLPSKSPIKIERHGTGCRWIAYSKVVDDGASDTGSEGKSAFCFDGAGFKLITAGANRN